LPLSVAKIVRSSIRNATPGAYAKKLAKPYNFDAATVSQLTVSREGAVAI